MKKLAVEDFERIIRHPEPKVYDTLGITKDEYLNIIKEFKEDASKMEVDVKDFLVRLGIGVDVWINNIASAVLAFKVSGKDANYTTLLSNILIQSNVDAIDATDFIALVQMINYTCLQANKMSTELLQSPLIKDMLLKGMRRD